MIFVKQGGKLWTGFMWLRNQWRAVVNAVIKLLGSIKGGEFLD
jgi:hypothetical protein